MDHISLPPDPAYPPLVVPCLASITYDGGDFHSYPARRGWDIGRLLIGDFCQHSEEDTATFLQDWLFFSVLRETLREAANKSVYLDVDPASSHSRVTTLNLFQHMYERLVYLDSLLAKNDPLIWTLIHQAEACLERLSYFCCLANCAPNAEVQWPLPLEVDLTLRVLGQRLTSAHLSVLGITAMKGSSLWHLKRGTPYLPMARMHKDSWCPSEISGSLEQFSPASLYYVSLLQRPTTTRDHSRCTDRKCFVFMVDESTHQTKHVHKHCSCSMLGPDVGTVAQIINNGKIPLLKIHIDERSDTVKICVDEYDNIKEYMAISHVWADGLGNARQNTLPYCQLHRLKRTLDELRAQQSTWSLLNRRPVDAVLRKKRNVSLRFWMDTLCIPVDPSLKHVRKQAIRQMKEIYHSSYQVLVLDAEIQIANASDMTEAFIRISLSGWTRHLWTLQEGVLGDHLHFRFKDSVFDV